MLFLKRIPEHRSVIDETEYVALRPDDHRHQVGRANLDGRYREAILGELDRKLREDPECLRARELYVRFSTGPELTRNVNR